MIGAATEKACLPRLSLVLGTQSCCQGDVARCLCMFDSCRTEETSQVQWLMCWSVQ